MPLRDRLRSLFQASPAVQPVNAPLTKELARADIRTLGLFGPVGRYNPDDLVGKKGLGIYDEMRRDEQVKAALALKTAAIVGPGWTLTAKETGNEAEQSLADLLTEDLLNIPGTFEDVLMQMLTALTFGFSITEKIFVDAGDRLALANVKTRAPFGFWFIQDEFGNLEGLRQDWFTISGEIFPPEKFIIFTHDPEFSNPYGRSDLWAAHKLWFIKRVFLQAWASFTERYGDPPAVSKYPKGTSPGLIAEVQKIIKNLQARTAISVPAEWMVELLQTSQNPREFFVNSLAHLDLGISRAILVPEKLGLAGGEVTGGSYSLSRVQLGAFYFILNLLKARVEAAINEQLIRPMAELTDPNVPPPIFALNPLSEENKDAIAELWGKLDQAQVVLSDVVDENHLRQMLGFREVEEKTEEMRDALLAKKKAQEQVAQNMPGGANGNPRGGVDVKAIGTPRAGGDLPPTMSATMAAVPGALPTPTQADVSVPETFWRPLRPLEERADMAEQRRILDEGSTELGMILADNVDAFIAQVRQRAESILARRNPEEISAMGIDSSLQAKAFAEGYAALGRSYVRGARKARSEVKR